MAHISSEILGLGNWFFMYCIIKKLHKITIDYSFLLGLCKKCWVKYGSGTLSLSSLLVNGKFCLLTNKQVFTWVIPMLGLVPLAQQLYYGLFSFTNKKLSRGGAPNMPSQNLIGYCFVT